MEHMEARMQDRYEALAVAALEEAVARRIYEGAHKGMRNIWGWDDGGLQDEHPGTRERFLGYARSAISVIATQPAPAEHVVGSLDDKTITDLAWKHFGESVFVLLTREKSEPMIPQETYDMPTFQLRQFVDACVHAALSRAQEPK